MRYRRVITRRQMLVLTLFLGVLGGLAARPLVGETVRVDPNRWILMADTHVWEVTDAPRRDTYPAANLATAIQQISTLDPRPAGAIVVGDCAAIDGREADYMVLQDTIGPLAEAGIPIYFTLGNHDNRETFYAVFPERKPSGEAERIGRHVRVIETPHANLFLLDSLDKVNVTPGLLGGEQLAWLAKELDARPNKPAILLGHHPLAPGHRHSDPNAEGTHDLQDTKELLDVIRPRKQVKAYIHGHSHQWRHATLDGIHLINLPAMGWLFSEEEPRAWVQLELEATGARLTLRPIAADDARDGETIELEWRE